MYFPGCTLKTTALNYEETALAVARKLGIELIELERWNCCGVVFNLAVDSAMHHVAAVRDLIRAQQMSKKIGDNRLVTLCSMCFNTLKRVNELVKSDYEKLETINKFMDEEEDYQCEIEVKHFLEILRDDIGFETIEKSTTKPLKNLKVAPYYGCTLVRPKDIGIDSPENPQVIENLVQAIGAEPVKFPYKVKCCGSYDIVYDRKIAEQRAIEIRKAASRWGANVIVVTCPLCHYNLSLQVRAPEIPIVYFTELMAIALGVDEVLDPQVRRIIYSIMGEIK